ncbi:PRSS12 [Acanthosepion pharaonis]|uniref:PRSS12 n=1 Tax=Acanthosepion pharaonis TaxID=158019 RepID=A0A812DG91_ACAPH|nr:PRSS12 [Sepia pharaonis]
MVATQPEGQAAPRAGVNTLGSITPTSSTDQNAIRIQLVNGSSEISGRIEITRGGTIGSICDDEFDDNDAKVICRMMGYSTGEEIPNIFGDGEGVIWLDNLNCTGSEYGVEMCPNLSWGKHNCKHSEDVAIKCFKKGKYNLIISHKYTSNLNKKPKL